MRPIRESSREDPGPPPGPSEETIDAGELVKALSSEVNLRILTLLSLRRSYTREIARIIRHDETDVSRRLRKLEALGLVRGRWARLGDRNVKVYELAVDEFRVGFRNGRLLLSLGTRQSSGGITVSPPLGAPIHGVPVGRERELEILRSLETPIVHVWGPPGIGKTHLVSYHLTESAGETPVYWHFSSDDDTVGILVWKLGFFLAGLGFDRLLSLDSPEPPLPLAAELAAEGLAFTGAILVIDDYHKLSGPAARLVLRIAELARDSRIYIISRRREKRLPYWRGLASELQLGPLPREAVDRLAIGVGRSGSEALWTWSQGIPAIIRLALDLARRGVNLEAAAREAARAYFEGSLPEILDEESQHLLASLALAGDWLPSHLACETAALKPSRCSRVLESLESMGLVEVSGDLVKLKEYVSGLAGSIREPMRTALLRRLASLLWSSPEHRDRVRALVVLARHCMVSEAAAIVRERLASGSSLMICCPSVYVEALRKLLSCRAPAHTRSYIAVEYALIHTYNMRGDIEAAIKATESLIRLLGGDAVVYARLHALLATMYLHIGDAERGWRAYREALKVYEKKLTPKERELIKSTILSTAAYVNFVIGDYDRAIEATLGEIEQSLAQGDPANYALARVHLAELYRYKGSFEESVRIIEETLRDEVLFPEGPPPEVIRVAAIPLAYSLIGLGRHENALEKVRGALNSNPGPYSGILNLIAATASYLLGDESKAAEHLEASGFLEACLQASLQASPDCIIALHLQSLLERGTTAEVPSEQAPPGIIAIVEALAAKTGK